MTNHSSPVNADDFGALRDVEVEWLSSELSRAISNLAYPVGMGIAPHETHIKNAAGALFERYAKMIEMARRAGIRAQQMPKPLSELEGEAWQRGYQHGRAEALRAPAQCVPDREQIAKVIWHRYAPDHHETWEDEQYQAEYLDCAAAILAAFTSPARCAPDREALVRAIQLSYARKDLEPTSATTLALYREDAENAADAVLALTRPPTEKTGE